jgi:hypothetical protein
MTGGVELEQFLTLLAAGHCGPADLAVSHVSAVLRRYSLILSSTNLDSYVTPTNLGMQRSATVPR